MNRREALRVLLAGASLPLAPGHLFALRAARAALGPLDAPRTLDAHQFATVTTLAEMILPRTETPGATDVGAAQFVDLVLTEWYEEDERRRFVSGLADVDRRSQSLFGKDFVDSAPPQQADILIALGAEMRDHAPGIRDHSPRNRGVMQLNDTFYSMLRRLTMVAYYTSEAGATQELKFEIIPDHVETCAPMTAAAKQGPGQP